MNSQPPGTVRNPSRPQPGRVYAFLVIALATFVVGLSIGPRVGAATAVADAAAPADLPAEWARPQLAVLMGVALLLGIVGGSLAGRRTKKYSGLLPANPQQVEQLTGLPVVGTLFPASRPAKSSALLRLMIFPAELILMLAVLLSFHAAVTEPTFARRFAQNPFSAYTQSVHDWQAWTDSTLRRWTTDHGLFR